MWMTIISFIGGPVIKGLIDGYKAKLAAGNTSEKIASETIICRRSGGTAATS